MASISDIISEKTYDFHEIVDGDEPVHGRKSNYWRTLHGCLVDKGAMRSFNWAEVASQDKFRSYILIS